MVMRLPTKKRRLSGIENLESRQLMAGDTMGPMSLPPVDADAIEIHPDIQLDEGVLDDWVVFPGDPLTGKWTNNSPWSSGLTEVEISKDGDDYHISAKGACFPKDCEWASVDLHAVGTSVEDTTPDFAIGKWDFDFKETTVTVEIVDHGLVVDLYSVFKDDSGRLPYHDSYWLNDDGDMIDVYYFPNESLADKIVGGWINEDVDTGNLEKIRFAETDEGLSAHAWGACGDSLCDWGSTPTHLVGSSISDSTPHFAVSNWEHSHAEVFTTSRVRGGDLIVEKYTVFTDDSGRSNYHTEDTYWKVGDSNRDGHFTTEDVVQAFMAGEYNDNIPGNSTWGEGDWNRDGDFDEQDLVEAFACGGFEAPSVSLIPRIPLERLQPFEIPGEDRRESVDQVIGFESLDDILLPTL